jgi:hypothetical protein
MVFSLSSIVASVFQAWLLKVCQQQRWRFNLPVDRALTIRLFLSSEYLSHYPSQRIVEFVNNALLERNNCVVGYVNVLRTNLRAALRNVAQADAQVFLQQIGT